MLETKPPPPYSQCQAAMDANPEPLALCSGLCQNIRFYICYVHWALSKRELPLRLTSPATAPWTSSQWPLRAALSPPPGRFHFHWPILQAAWAFQHMSFLSHRVPFVQTLSWGLIFYTEHFKGSSLTPAGTIILHSRTMVFSSFSLNPLSSNRNLIEGPKISNRKARTALP